MEKEQELLGHGISTCALCDGNLYKEKTIAVVGGGNTALEETLYLSNLASKIYLIHRRDTFRAEQTLIEKIKQKANIEILYNSEVTKLIEEQNRLNKIEINHEIPGSSGGFSNVECMIKGKNVYSKLKYESGAHRVQRVPETESQGRIQTSTATVAVMPEAEDLDFELDMNEIRIDITRSSGCGGQGVNTTDSAVRLTHLPTGIIVYSQTERSQIKNKEIAIKIMKTRLYDLKLREKEEAEGAERRNKIGTGDRAEKIRTYNYPQNRVTDHRIGFSVMNLDRVMDGDLEAIIEALITEDQRRKLENE